jgi:membrane associated rhomboid family serine protease
MQAFKAQPVYENFWAFFNETPLPGIAGNKPIFEELSREIRNGNPTVIAQSYDEMRDYLQTKMDIPVVGASGAIYGLLLGFGMKFPNAELMLLFLPVPIKAKYFIPILMLGELILGVNNFSWDNIAHFAHLGGALAGLLLILYWRKFSANPW